MENTARRRLMSEYRKLVENPLEGISAEPLDDNLFIWKAFITGLRDTPWQRGRFELRLQFSDDHPNRPPIVCFVCPMFHPNVYQCGAICLNILEGEWSPDYEAKEILLAVQFLLSNPNPASPANAIASILFEDDKHEYERRVQEIVEQNWQHS
uniref:UBC core domain-containing protein n=1 Tax=Ananas comosus var. bracteatus TaxID=296719 RepID=A0A6V7QJS0_ANACO|nr:unnamed protein product [Ananas comosus var. bracteatus]